MAEWVRALACTGDRMVPTGFESHCGKLRFGTLAIPFTPLCQCLSEETLKAVGPFYLVSMPGEVKDPTGRHWNVSLSWTPPPTLTPPAPIWPLRHWRTADYNTRQGKIVSEDPPCQIVPFPFCPVHISHVYCICRLHTWSFTGTLRPDLIESASELASGKAAMIKTHHNDTELVRQLRKQVMPPSRQLT